MTETAIEDTKPWSPLKKALWDVVMKAEINAKYVAAFPFVDELYAAALSALHAKAGVSVDDGSCSCGGGGSWGHATSCPYIDEDEPALSTKLQEPVGWLYEWPNGRKEFRSSDKPKDFDAWAATITPLYTSPTLAHQPVTAGLEKEREAWALVQEGYDILCSGKPPFAPRETNGRSRIRQALETLGIKKVAHTAASAPKSATSDWKPTHRHVKRGSEYTLIGHGKMQAKNWQVSVDGFDQSIDMQEVAIYQGEDGQYWVRPIAEFNDGRFAALKSEGRK